MFAYCGNNPILYVDPSGYIIVLHPGATEEQKEEYERAIAYLKTSETGKKLIELLESSSVVFTIEFIDDDKMRYESATHTIYFDINSGLVVGDGTSVQSAALGLAHEMGHAAQYLSGKYVGYLYDVEAHNLETYETPIANELGEPTRNYYYDDFGPTTMQNSIHFRTTSISTAPRPWWHYLLIWKLFTPMTVVTDHNVND